MRTRAPAKIVLLTKIVSSARKVSSTTDTFIDEEAVVNDAEDALDWELVQSIESNDAEDALDRNIQRFLHENNAAGTESDSNETDKFKFGSEEQPCYNMGVESVNGTNPSHHARTLCPRHAMRIRSYAIHEEWIHTG